MQPETDTGYGRAPWGPAENAELIALCKAEKRDVTKIALKMRRSRTAVYSQASRLGLFKGGSGAMIRACKGCESDFPSEGIFKRICFACRQSKLFRYA